MIFNWVDSNFILFQCFLKTQVIILKFFQSSEIKLQEIHAELENSISTINSLTQELTEKESAISSKDDILQNKDDIIRDLKAKLEAAPENVPVDPEDEQSVLAAHNQTKAELNALKVNNICKHNETWDSRYNVIQIIRLSKKS